LAADEIMLSRHAVLGPVDPQIGEYAAASILRAVAKKPAEKIDDRTLILADQAEMAIRQVREAVEELLEGTLPSERVKDAARTLSEGRWTHDRPLRPEEARDLGLRVNTDMPPEFLQLMGLFPQPVRRTPSVEYIPGPRRAAERGPSRSADSI
jgi:ClpP class serine protease